MFISLFANRTGAELKTFIVLSRNAPVPKFFEPDRFRFLLNFFCQIPIKFQKIVLQHQYNHSFTRYEVSWSFSRNVEMSASFSVAVLRNIASSSSRLLRRASLP